MPKFVNLTPHALSLYTTEGVRDIPASGRLCRVKTRPEFLQVVDGMPVYTDAFDGIEDLPDPEVGIVFLVSGLVLTAMKDAGIKRSDVLAPGTGPLDGAIRDHTNRVTGVTRLKAA